MRLLGGSNMKKIVTFTASWCGPCKMLKAVLKDLNEASLIVWENHDVDEEKDLAIQMEIKSVPKTFFYDENGEIFRDEVGYMPRERVLQIYNASLKNNEYIVEPEPEILAPDPTETEV